MVVCYNQISCTNIALMQMAFGLYVLSSSIHLLQKSVSQNCASFKLRRELSRVFLALLKYETVQEQSCMTTFSKCFTAAFCTCLFPVLLFGCLQTEENRTQNQTSQQVPSDGSLPSLRKNVSEH